MTTEPKWIEHDGSAECPVPAGHDVEVRFHSGDKVRDCAPAGWDWEYYSGSGCITHYRDWTAWEKSKMTTEPKLLTEAEWRERIAAWGASEHAHHILADLRERGLIAEEPVDPLLVEAVKIIKDHNYCEGDLAQDVALAALRRGMELAPRKELTQGPRYQVPEGQTSLDDNLRHRYLDVIREGERAFDSGEGSPYHGYSLEHCLHAVGWVKRDLRVALDKANERIAALTASELAPRKELTREALDAAIKIADLQTGAMRFHYAFNTALHAALTEALQ